MIAEILSEIRSVSGNMKNTIIKPIEVDGLKRTVYIKLITDMAFTPSDKAKVAAVLKKYVPAYFSVDLEISKLTPDCEMVKRKITEAVCSISKAVFATISQEDIKVEKTENGFKYGICAVQSLLPANFCNNINAYLSSNFCGGFEGEILSTDKNLEDLEVEESYDEPEFEIPVRTFEIDGFEFLEGEKIQKRAVYLSDLNLAKDEVVVCGIIEDIRERAYTNKNGTEKSYFTFVLNDNTATAYITYFARLKTFEKIKTLKIGDGIVCTGMNEEFRGNLRYTAKTIDIGKMPQGFVPERRKSKPVPRYYKNIRPQPFVDLEQTDLFNQKTIPACLLGKSFVVFDLETTGLNSSPVSGNMDRIIEIGAFKVENGEITESFSTFINPEKKLSEEIIALTGITEDMVKDAPTFEQAMPDFYKFCTGCTLVGHNVVGFDFKFVDYYCSTLGYILERKLIDTIPLSQELLFLSNYKLNTVADKFNITFNHHRAIDDALATAKIFIELIRLKKSLPDYR